MPAWPRRTGIPGYGDAPRHPLSDDSPTCLHHTAGRGRNIYSDIPTAPLSPRLDIREGSHPRLGCAKEQAGPGQRASPPIARCTPIRLDVPGIRLLHRYAVPLAGVTHRDPESGIARRPWGSTWLLECTKADPAVTPPGVNTAQKISSRGRFFPRASHCVKMGKIFASSTDHRNGVVPIARLRTVRLGLGGG